MSETKKPAEVAATETAPKKSPAKKATAPKAEGTTAKKTTKKVADAAVATQEVAAKPAKKAAAPKAEGTTAKKTAKKAVEEVAATVTEEVVAPAKPVAKSKSKKNAPLYINGRYVKQVELKAKPAKGSKPYELTKKQLKITLVKSVNGCLAKQQRTIAALGLKKIGHSVVKLDNAALQGMLFVVKHLVVVQEVK